MISNTNRLGRITSSNAHLIMAKGKSKTDTFSAGCLTYLNKKKQERKLKRSVSVEKGGRSATWGKVLEGYVFDMLFDPDYELQSTETHLHPKYGEFWSGSPDLVAHDKIGDIKCFEPYEFSLLADIINAKDSELLKANKPDIYWQLLSNAHIMGLNKVEIVAFMPYVTELGQIMDYLDNLDSDNPFAYKFISDAIFNGQIDELPYLPIDSEYKNLNRFEFEVNQDDMDLLEQRMILANDILKN